MKTNASSASSTSSAATPRARVLALYACALVSMPISAAFAQTAPYTDDAAQQSAAQTDPPGRVARLNYMAGAVTTEPAGASDWSYAQLNRPLTTGDQLWNDENARSELHVGSTAMRLGSSTAMSILALDDTHAQFKIAQGTLSMRAREVPPGTQYEIDTPNAALAMTSPGDVRVDVAPDGRTTTVTVRGGGITAYGDGGSMPLAPGQQVTFEGTNLQQASANAAPAPDAFDQWAASRDAAEDRSISARYVSRDIPGYQDLDANGTWRNDPSYGAIWVPNAVSADWAPYRQGHWVWQAPWGWTWVDDAPWGFAPYHYGRWAYVGSQWAWVPGPMVASAPPVYSPALVAFVGDGGGGVDWNVALTVGGVAAAGVAWFALGPGEAWHPHHDGWSPRYYDRVNRNVYVDRSVHINNTYVNYRAPRALSALPASGFVRGQQAGRQPVGVDPSRWRHPRFIPGTPAIAPTRDSFAPGARRADYRPPQGGFARPVVATRAPVAPPAFHDRLAQQYAQAHGGRAAGTSPVAASPGRAGLENVHLVATHGPARTVIEPHAGAAPGNGPTAANGAARGVPMPQNAHMPMANTANQRNTHVPQQWGNVPTPTVNNADPRGARMQQQAPSPAIAQSMQQHGDGVPHPPSSAQFARSGDNSARFVHNEASHPQPQANAPRIERGGMNAPMQTMQQPHIERSAPPMPMQTAQPRPQPIHQARMEPPHQSAPPPQQQPRPQPQPMPQMQHPQQPQQAQQPHGNGNNNPNDHHRG